MKIVVSDCDHDSMAIETEVFKKAGMSFELFQCKTEADAIAQLKGANIIINQYTPMTRKVIAALRPELKQIVRYGVGVNNIDLVAASDLGVQACNVPDYSMSEVSDQALAMALALARKVVQMNALTHAGAWDYQKSIPVFRIAGSTIGVIGLGRIGRMFAKKAAALDAKIVGFDAYYKPNAADGSEYITSVSLDELLKTSDIISINCPLTDETRHMIDDAAFAKMKPTAYIVNASRGGIIDEAALARALEAKTIAGAALDVAEVEPLPADSPLRKLDTCLLTPHMAWYSEQAGLELKRKVAEEACRFAKGEAVKYPVNKLK